MASAIRWPKDAILLLKNSITIFFFFKRVLTLWRPFLIHFYHQIKTPIGFWYKNHRSLIQLSVILLVKLTRTDVCDPIMDCLFLCNYYSTICLFSYFSSSFYLIWLSYIFIIENNYFFLKIRNSCFFLSKRAIIINFLMCIITFRIYYTSKNKIKNHKKITPSLSLSLSMCACARYRDAKFLCNFLI